MGYQPGLDGLRAASVIVIMLYHGGFPWIHGGFFAVEVFFAVSGYLITSLLVEERERMGRVALRTFWARRARRLVPALSVTLAVVAIVTLVAGTDAQLASLRRDLPWAIFYAGNWGQIVGDIPYYAGDPPLLRHLWTLAIEEQFYVLWPLAFLFGLSRLRDRSAARLLVVFAGGASVLAFWIHAGGPGPMGGWFDGAERTNFMYLSTGTRAGALLLGAAAAFWWRPWRAPAAASARGRLDVLGAAAIALFGCVAVTASITAGYVYQWLLGVMSVVALVLVLVVVHPGAIGMRRLFAWRPLVEIGKRSYGLYLWHWPAFVFAGATNGSWAPFLAALAVTAVTSELCYRFVETPVRTGALGRWWQQSDTRVRQAVTLSSAAGVVVLVGCYAAVAPYDRAVGGDEVSFTPPPSPAVAAPVPPTVPTTLPAAVGAPAVSAAPPSTVAAPPVPAVRRVTVVGDSQGHSLAVNQPQGIEDTFVVNNGAVPGCSVYSNGGMRSARDGIASSFSMCEGWQDEWASAVRDADAEIALVVLGAWDVFDLLTDDGEWLAFGTPAWDAYVAANLQTGIDALSAAEAKVALLEAPCMRPRDVEGAGVPALPERADDDRVAHVNGVFRQVAATNAATTTFVEGPEAWCTDESVAGDPGLRWDGVHVFGRGATLIMETIAPSLQSL